MDGWMAACLPVLIDDNNACNSIDIYYAMSNDDDDDDDFRSFYNLIPNEKINDE